MFKRFFPAAPPACEFSWVCVESMAAGEARQSSWVARLAMLAWAPARLAARRRWAERHERMFTSELFSLLSAAIALMDGHGDQGTLDALQDFRPVFGAIEVARLAALRVAGLGEGPSLELMAWAKEHAHASYETECVCFAEEARLNEPEGALFCRKEDACGILGDILNHAIERGLVAWPTLRWRADQEKESLARCVPEMAPAKGGKSRRL